eukprot:SAG31_NODE_22423_length_526_cov_0.583138_1_plen_117_part_00
MLKGKEGAYEAQARKKDAELAKLQDQLRKQVKVGAARRAVFKTTKALEDVRRQRLTRTAMSVTVFARIYRFPVSSAGYIGFLCPGAKLDLHGWDGRTALHDAVRCPGLKFGTPTPL